MLAKVHTIILKFGEMKISAATSVNCCEHHKLVLFYNTTEFIQELINISLQRCLNPVLRGGELHVKFHIAFIYFSFTI